MRYYPFKEGDKVRANPKPYFDDVSEEDNLEYIRSQFKDYNLTFDTIFTVTDCRQGANSETFLVDIQCQPTSHYSCACFHHRLILAKEPVKFPEELFTL